MKKVSKPSLALFAMLFAVVLFMGQGARGESATRETTARTGPARRYASVNGLKMYYEIHGTGRPLVLLHGALCTIDGCLGKILPRLAKPRRVIAMEQQAHGRTAVINRPLTIEQMAEDTVAPTFTARGAPRHHPCDARGPRRLAGLNGYTVSRRAHAKSQVICDAWDGASMDLGRSFRLDPGRNYRKVGPPRRNLRKMEDNSRL